MTVKGRFYYRCGCEAIMIYGERAVGGLLWVTVFSNRQMLDSVDVQKWYKFLKNPKFLTVEIYGKLMFTHLIGLKNTSKLLKCPPAVNCRILLEPAAVNYRGKPRQLTAVGFLFPRHLTADDSWSHKMAEPV